MAHLTGKINHVQPLAMCSRWPNLLDAEANAAIELLLAGLRAGTDAG